MYSINTILHPTDFSERSRNAFEMACSMAIQHGASVILLHVATPPGAAPMPHDAVAARSDEIDEVQLRDQLEELRSAKPNLTMDYVLERGDPRHEILRVAEEAACDAIVMGTHGRTGLNRLLMGSVAEYIVRHAPCPVVTVKAPMAEEVNLESATTTSASK